MKKVLGTLLAASLILSMGACSSKPKETQAPAETKAEAAKEKKEETAEEKKGEEKEEKQEASEKKKVKIGVSNCADTDTFTKMVADYLEQLIAENQPDWEASFVGAEMDSSIQLSQIESFISQGCDYIVMSSSDTNGCVPCVEACQAAGIPLIDFVNPIAAPEEDFVYVGGSNVNCGRQMAEWACTVLPENGNVVIMEGQAGGANSLDRIQGIKEVFAEKRPDVTILASKTANWEREEGMALMEDWLQAYGDKINVVLALNDNMALGAVEAIKARDMLGKIHVCGVDGTKDAMEYIKEGSLDVSMFYNYVKQATNTYNVLVDMVESEADTHEDVYSDFEEVNKDNVQEYLDKYYS
ncbi:sugar ABC transporter substrate-binding protein [Clostridium sp. AM58-1XD]|uniref:sugar ABC transporter substrate-binding protein n=1 Tax=Clostridium sp. AM58-1XD TaxID=2292307 RepID=UPI0015F53AF5|nr:sugar ABC transporter substrate-binding protein [Clostridium sp. AM58-1XD]